MALRAGASGALQTLRLRRRCPGGARRCWSSAPAPAPLPAVDVAALRGAGSASAAPYVAAARALDAACRSPGFAYVSGHGVDAALLGGARDAVRHFLEVAPVEEKARVAMHDDPTRRGAFRGWQALGRNVTRYGADGADDRDAPSFSRDAHEAIDLYAELPDGRLPAGSWARGANPWPRTPPDFEDAIRRYVEQMEALGADLMRGLAVGMGLKSTAFDHALERPFWSMRGILYPPLPPLPDGSGCEGGDRWAARRAGELERSQAISCGEHSDYGVLTLVNQDMAPEASLQVRAADGHWIDAAPRLSPGGEPMLVVNVGDMLARWTNGRYVATPHRVIHAPTSGRGRVSVPFFYEPSFDACVEPLPDLLAKGGQKARYDAVVYGEHLTRKVTSNFA